VTDLSDLVAELDDLTDEQLARLDLTPQERAVLMRAMTDPDVLTHRELIAARASRSWLAGARREQMAPAAWRAGEYSTWYVRGGRGAGKTFTGSNNLADLILDYWDEPGEWGVVAPTFEKDAVATCLESQQSGLLVALGARVGPGGGLVERGPYIARYVASAGEVWLANGGVVYAAGADSGADRVQGKNLKGCWCEEIGLWKRWRQAWEESIAFAVRLEPGLIIVTGTPKAERDARALVKKLIDDPNVIKTVLRTRENLANLSQTRAKELLQMEGTRRGRQELDGELLEEIEGALWTLTTIESDRLVDPSGNLYPLGWILENLRPKMAEIVVGVDPSGSNSQQADECGIVVVGKGNAQLDGHGYVLDDRSDAVAPHVWARAAVDAYRFWQADAIVCETNFGGEMVVEAIHNVDPGVPVRRAHAARGKLVRAEPVSVLYGEAHMIHHVAIFPELEEQMTSFTRDSRWSPDRMDALVWGFSKDGQGGGRGGLDITGGSGEGWKTAMANIAAKANAPARRGGPIDRPPRFLT
jgi:phage terminase large subunit-like protein